jgi:Aspartyl/Asparaginyl beta-hydroxylase.
MIETLKLPFGFDAAALKADLEKFSASDWKPHFNTAYYEGDWSGIALRAAGGAPLDLYPDPNASVFENTEMLARCAYVPEVLDFFRCEIETARFLRLGTGAKILEHRDYKLGFEDGIARIHIPVRTNAQVEFRLNGKIVRMKEGEAWYLNFNLPHSVVNGGGGERVHLVIDCIVNDWLKDFFEREASN